MSYKTGVLKYAQMSRQIKKVCIAAHWKDVKGGTMKVYLIKESYIRDARDAPSTLFQR